MTGIELDLRITFGNIIEIMVILSGGIVAVTMMRARVVLLTKEMTVLKAETKTCFSDMKASTATQLGVINGELKRVGDILISLADQHRRIIHLEDDVREMKHGRGYVEGPRGIGGVGN